MVPMRSKGRAAYDNVYCVAKFRVAQNNFHMIKKPKLQFCPWMRWEERKHYPQRKLPGVYMLAIINKPLNGKTPRFEDVKYIGMTNAKGGLISRWNQFNNSIHGKFGHSGGKSVFKDLKNYKTWKEKLFVCALPVKCSVSKDIRTPQDLIKMGWIAFLEYEALSKYRELFKEEPKYNTK